MKKIPLYILIVFVLVNGLPGFFGLNLIKTEAAATTTTSKVVDASNTSQEGMLKGVWCFHWTEGLNLAGCSAIAASYSYSISSNILSVSGSLFDTLLSFSLSKIVIDQNFVKVAWKTTRDFANILFILALVVISISMILDLGKFASKKLVVDVIIIALAINFSLFAARVIIDSSNIVALGFYNAINAAGRNVDKPLIEKTGIVEKNISGAIMSSFNPARLVSPESFRAWKRSYVNSVASNIMADLAITFVFSGATLLNLFTAYLFFMASFLFVIRIAWLWILMAVAPLAFVSFIIPDLRNHWTKWWINLMDKSFCIVIFLFLVWLTLLIVNGDFFKGAFVVGSNPSLLRLMTLVGLQFAIVYKLLSISLEQTKKRCNDGGIGDKALGWVRKGSGFVAGVATGGFSLYASQKIGGWATKTAEKTRDSGGGTTRMGKLRLKTLDKISSVSFAPTFAKFGKESYKQREERVSQEHKDYIKTLPKKIKTGSFSDEDAQKIYLKNIRKASLFAVLKGERAGEEKFFTDRTKLEGSLNKLDSLKLELAQQKDKVKALKKNPGAQNVARVEQIRLEKEIKKEEEKIKKYNKKSEKKKK